jgi:predicted SPOUT superfamily RNA methylase MTH1
MRRDKVRLEEEKVDSQSEDSSEDEEELKRKITVAEYLKSNKLDVASLISTYEESDDDEKRGYVKKDDINRKSYDENKKEEEEEEDIAAMKQRLKKKMREARAKDIKRRKKKREKRREMRSGNLIIEEQKESVMNVTVINKNDNIDIVKDLDSKPTSTVVESKVEKPKQPVKETIKVYKTPAYKRKHYTVSIAIPGSILSDAKGEDMIRTHICGEIARTAALFRIDEIIVYNETATPVDMSHFLPNIQKKVVDDQQEEYQDMDGSQYKSRYEHYGSGKRLPMDDNVYMANILYFLETPPYLRSKLFPGTLECLRYAVNLPALGAPHHLMAREFPHRYRDGVIVQGEGNLVFIGHQKLCLIKNHLPPGIRVTIETYKEEKDFFMGRIVSSSDPKTKEGMYWGYNVRIANSLSHVLTECPHAGGYDMVIACGEGGRSVDDDDYSIRPFKNLLIVFGKASNETNDDGLSNALSNDKRIPYGTDIRDVFDQYIDVCPHRGSKILRTQEAITITLSTLRKRLDRNTPPVTPSTSKFSSIKLRC